MNAVFQAASEIRAFLEAKGWSYCIIGGIAAARWGRPRVTQDVDISLFTEFGDEERFVQALLEAFAPRISGALDFALTRRIVLIQASNAVPIDVGLAGFDYEADMIARGSDFEFEPGVILRTVSAEDVIVLKAFADRPQDWIDINGVLTRQGKKLDWAYIRRVLPPLCEIKESREILDRLEKLRVETLK